MNYKRYQEAAERKWRLHREATEAGEYALARKIEDTHWREFAHEEECKSCDYALGLATGVLLGVWLG